MTRIFLLHVALGVAVVLATVMVLPWGEARAASQQPAAHQPSPVDGTEVPSPHIETICACPMAVPAPQAPVAAQA
jgi:hypothetical protein